MTDNETTITITSRARPSRRRHGGLFAGNGERRAQGQVPGLPEIAPQTRLWALFAANGQPILLSDERDRALAGAFENDLTPVAMH